MLTASFHYSILESFREQMVETTQGSLDYNLVGIVAHKSPHNYLPNSVKEFVSEIKETKNEIHDILDGFNCLTLKILCRTAMGVDVGKENSDFNQYRNDVEKMKNLFVKRNHNPLYWNEFIWNLTSHGRLQKNVIARLHKFTHGLIYNRLEEYRGMSSKEIEDISSQYSSGKVKRKLALLDTMMFALDQKELT